MKENRWKKGSLTNAQHRQRGGQMVKAEPVSDEGPDFQREREV